MYLCLKCNNQRDNKHVIVSIETDKKTGKTYLITKCSYCKTGLDIEELKRK